MAEMTAAFVVLITGCSGVGKSTVSKLLAQRLERAYLIHQDDFFAGAFVPYASAADDTMERPEHIDWQRLCSKVKSVSHGQTVLVEGHNLLSSSRLRAMASLVLCLVAPDTTCCERRVQRTPRTRMEGAELKVYFETHVIGGHKRFGRADAERLLVDGPLLGEPLALRIDASTRCAEEVAEVAFHEVLRASHVARRVAVAVAANTERLQSERLSLAKLCVRILHDTPPPRAADALYVFSELPQNAPATYAATAAAISREPGVRVLITSEDGTRCTGFGGAEEMKRGLIGAGVPRNAIELVAFDAVENMIHTRNESEFLVKHCRKRGYTRVLLVAPPFHAVRAYATAVSALLREGGADLWFYAHPARADDWSERVTHSQGTVVNTRVGLIDGELERIERYQAKGDIEPCRVVLDYLARREASANLVDPRGSDDGVSAQCLACGAEETSTSLSTVHVPKFGPSLIASFSCSRCGYAFSSISETGSRATAPGVGRRIELRVQDDIDLAREVVCSASCSIEIPALGILFEGSSASRITTIEGLVRGVCEGFDRVAIVRDESNGDAQPSSEARLSERCVALLQDVIGRSEFGFVVVLDDASGHSRVGSRQGKEVDEIDESLIVKEYSDEATQVEFDDGCTATSAEGVATTSTCTTKATTKECLAFLNAMAGAYEGDPGECVDGY